MPYQYFNAEPTAGFVSVDQAHANFDRSGALERERLVLYRGDAISATVVAFDLERAGHESVRVYDGSLQEWAADPSLPMTTDS